MAKITIDRKLMEFALEALRFYADGNHEVTLTGFKDGQRIDWKSERARLEKSGYSFSHENYDCTENFVEDGSRAQTAVDALEAAIAEVQEPDSPERRCGGPGCDGTCCQPVQEPPYPGWKMGCQVCGAHGATGYSCPRSDCPTRVTCGGAV